jgi:hypothetical protein
VSVGVFLGKGLICCGADDLSVSPVEIIHRAIPVLMGYNCAQGQLNFYNSEAVEIMSKQTRKNQLKFWRSLLFSSS